MCIIGITFLGLFRSPLVQGELEIPEQVKAAMELTEMN